PARRLSKDLRRSSSVKVYAMTPSLCLAADRARSRQTARQPPHPFYLAETELGSAAPAATSPTGKNEKEESGDKKTDKQQTKLAPQTNRQATDPKRREAGGMPSTPIPGNRGRASFRFQPASQSSSGERQGVRKQFPNLGRQGYAWAAMFAC